MKSCEKSTIFAPLNGSSCSAMRVFASTVELNPLRLVANSPRRWPDLGELLGDVRGDDFRAHGVDQEVGIAEGVNVALGAIERGRISSISTPCDATIRPWAPRRSCCCGATFHQRWQPTEFQLGAAVDEGIRAVERDERGFAGIDEARIFGRSWQDLHVDLVRHLIARASAPRSGVVATTSKSRRWWRFVVPNVRRGGGQDGEERYDVHCLTS